MLRVKCYIYDTYLYSHVVGLLQQYGLRVESVSPDGDRVRDWRKMWVIGSVSREQVADLWKVRGLMMMMDLK